MVRDPPDPKHILHAASDFRIASELLAERFGPGKFPLRSTVVTAAFSIELYLKYLVAREGQPAPRGHDLVDLFGKVPPATRAKIAASFQGDVLEVLTPNRGIFEEWRYIFERQGKDFFLDFRSLLRVVKALRTVAESKG
jgi:hypothetical protein